MPLIFNKTSKSGKALLIRPPQKEDVHAMCAYINTLSQERSHLRFQGEIISLECEQQFLRDTLKSIDRHQGMMLLVFCKDNLVGMSHLTMDDRTQSHIGSFGISIAKDYRSDGIGSILSVLLLEEAIKNCPQLEIITLAVHSNNLLAKAMYEKMGFITYGLLPDGVKLQTKRIDQIFMYKTVKS